MSVEMFSLIYLVASVVIIQVLAYVMSRGTGDKAVAYIAANLLGIPLTLFFLMLTLEILVVEKGLYSRIVQVGGCDRYGECRVKTESGHFTSTRDAFVGEKVKVERELRWRYSF